jgi:predicted GIY-YIG superfamily endonuclease
MAAWFYILRLKSGALYVGATNDLHHRKPAFDEKKFPVTVRNLNMLSWIETRSSTALPIKEEEIFQV